MGTETGATTSIFPSDERTREYLDRPGQGRRLDAACGDEGAEYDEYEEIDLSKLEPLIAKPSSPGNVVPVREVAGIKVDQVIVGSSVNSSFRDLMISAQMLEGRRVHPDTNFHVNPGQPPGARKRGAAGRAPCVLLIAARACTSPAARDASAWARRRAPER